MKRIFCLVLGACNLDSDLTTPPDGAMNMPDVLEQRCDLQKDFGVPVPIAELNLSTFTEADGVFSSDLRTAYFRSGRTPNAGAEDLWFATRSDSSGTFGTPVQVQGVNGSGYEGKPVLTEDELTIVFGRDNTTVLATRGSKTEPFGSADPVQNVNAGGADLPTWMNAVGTRLYMFSDRGGSNDNDLFVASRASSAVAFGTPIEISELNSSSADADAALTADEKTIFFGSVRDGTTDVFVAHRSSATGTFGAPEKVDALSSTTSEDIPSWVSPDGCQIIFHSNRTGSFDLFLATRPN
jgi:Tol biopolymer transport system component